MWLRLRDLRAQVEPGLVALNEGQAVRVFVVEDQKALRRSLIKALGAYPEIEVVGSAEDGEEAIEAIAKAQVDLVLLDLELPGLGGIDVTRRLKGRTNGAEILILTSFDDEQKVYEAISAGASGYLVKRVGPDRIRSAIHQVLEGGCVLEPVIARRFWNYFQSLTCAAEAKDNPWGLNQSELEVLGYLAKGLSNAEVSRVMAIERRTVRTHLGHLYAKMGVSGHVDAVVKGLKAGVVKL